MRRRPAEPSILDGPTRTVLDLHGVGIGLWCPDEPRWLDLLRERFALFTARSDAAAEIEFDFGPLDAQRPTPLWRPIYESTFGTVVYSSELDEIQIGAKRLWLRCRCSASNVQVRIDPSIPNRDWLLSRPIFTFPLFELMKRRGFFGLHAAAVAVDGNSIILTGASGSGKTTLALALARAGLDFIADELVFIARSSSGFRVHALPEAPEVTSATTAFFPNLSALPSTEAGLKRRIRDDPIRMLPVLESSPVAIIYPELSRERQPRLELMSPDAARNTLCRTILRTDQRSTQSQFDALCDLAQHVPCYRLLLGEHPNDATQLLRGVLRK